MKQTTTTIERTFDIDGHLIKEVTTTVEHDYMQQVYTPAYPYYPYYPVTYTSTLSGVYTGGFNAANTTSTMGSITNINYSKPDDAKPDEEDPPAVSA